MRCAALLPIVVLACETPRAPAQTRGPVTVATVSRAPAPPAPRDESLITPCAPASPDATAAKDTLAALTPRIDALGVTDSPAKLESEIAALLATPCFILVRDDLDRPLAWSTALSLKTWWSDGGHDWLAGALTIEPAPGRVIVGSPPTPRAALTLEMARPDDPLRALLCSARAALDRSCGVETAGWRIRVDHAPQNVVPVQGQRERYCAERRKHDTSGASPYAVFRACLNGSETADVMPLGVFQSPKEGWFIVSRSVFIAMDGCRDAVAAYDLATGAAYVVGCAPAPPARLAIGRVPLGALREAAWMSMLQHTAQADVQRYAAWFDVPRDLAVARRPGEKVPSTRITIDTSDAPTIQWAWVRGKPGALKGHASGRYDTSSSALASHAAGLLRIAEAAFQEGCAPAPPPRNLPWTSMGPNVTPGVRPDTGEQFESVDHAKTMLANAPAPGSAPCPIVP